MKTKNFSSSKIPLLLAAALSAVLLAGCNSTPSETADVAGSYKLVSVDGKNVPCAVSHNNMTINVQSGVFNIRADGQCNSVIQMTSPSGKPLEKSVAATCSRKDGALTFRWKGAGQTVGTVVGETFTMNNEGMAFVYKRQPPFDTSR